MNDAAPIFRDSDAPRRRIYDTATCHAQVLGSVIRVRRKRWLGLCEDVFEEPVANYRAVSMARESRYEYFLARLPTQFAQVILVHKFDHERDVILWEESCGPLGGTGREFEQRAAWESLSTTFGLAAITRSTESSHAGAHARPSPQQVFDVRRPEELSWSVRDYVSRGKISVPSGIPDTPHGVRIAAAGHATRIDFRYSTLRETWRGLRFVLALMAFLFAGRFGRRFPAIPLNILLLTVAGLIFSLCAVLMPILHFMNGSTMEIDEKRIVYRPGRGVNIFPSVSAEYVIPLQKIEAIRNRGFHVLIETDAQLVYVLCPSPAIAHWFEVMLMAVAAHGPSVLADRVEPAPKP